MKIISLWMKTVLILKKILKLINDKEICTKIAKKFKAKILNTSELYLNNHANEINQTINQISKP